MCIVHTKCDLMNDDIYTLPSPTTSITRVATLSSLLVSLNKSTITWSAAQATTKDVVCNDIVLIWKWKTISIAGPSEGPPNQITCLYKQRWSLKYSAGLSLPFSRKSHTSRQSKTKWLYIVFASVSRVYDNSINGTLAAQQNPPHTSALVLCIIRNTCMTIACRRQPRRPSASTTERCESFA